MKQGNSLITLVMVLLALGLTGYLGFYVWDTFNAPYVTTVAYSYTINDSAEADGLLVRAEQVLRAPDGIVDVTRAEGEKVGVGQTVALIYRDGQARDAQAAQDDLRREIEVLEFAVSQSGDTLSAARLNEDILQTLAELRGASARNDYGSLEQQVTALKSGILKRDYTYGEGLTGADLSARLTELRDQLAALTRSAAGDTTAVKASIPGVFSSLVDGWETVTPEQVLALDPAGLAELLAGSPGTGSAGTAGKLISGDRWYFAAVLDADTAARLTEGGSATLRFSGDFSRDVPMTVERLSNHDGKTAAVFSSDKYLAKTTLLRRQTAELIFDSDHGVRAPKAALRMETRQEAVPDSSQTKEVNVLGVYAVVNGKAVFKRVEIVSEGADFYVLRAAAEGKNALVAGDEIIVRGVGLFDGKLLEF